MRKLKYHERKLLKKTNLLHWKKRDNPNEAAVIGANQIEDRDEYIRYNKIRGHITKMANSLSLLPTEDPYRKKMTALLLDRLFSLGFIEAKRDLSQCGEVTVSSICKRRLPNVMVKIGMVPSIRDAVTFVKHGHVRIGLKVVDDPNYIVTPKQEEVLTWIHTSAVKRHIETYNNTIDDYHFIQH